MTIQGCKNALKEQKGDVLLLGGIQFARDLVEEAAGRFIPVYDGFSKSPDYERQREAIDKALSTLRFINNQIA